MEVTFTNYELKNAGSLGPHLKNWRSDVCTLYASWKGSSPDLTLRNLVCINFPEARVLSDITNFDDNIPIQPPPGHETKSSQTTERIYTFPTPLPSALSKDSVTWAEPEIKPTIAASGELWHARLGHANDDCMRQTAEAYPFFEIPKRQRTNYTTQPVLCECCAKCKAQIKRKMKPSIHKATRYLERVHMDMCGPLQMKTYEGCQYFTVFIDEFTKYRWVYVHNDKTKALEILREFIHDATKGTDNKIDILRTDQASEFLSKPYRQELEKHNINFECSCAYEHFQNGYAEKCVRDICTMARCMLEYGKVARDMWGYAVRYAAYVQNRIVHKGLTTSPYESRYGEAPDLARLRVFGCSAYFARDKKDTDYIIDKKLDPRGAMGAFMGIAEDGGEIQGAAVKGYIIWTLETGPRIVTTTQVKFDESSYPQLMGITEWEFSMQTQARKCRATVTVMNFETEPSHRHPILFDTEELQFRESQELTRFKPEFLIGLDIDVQHQGRRHRATIYNYLKGYRLWGVVLHSGDNAEKDMIYLTTSHLADSNKVKFLGKVDVLQQFIDKPTLRTHMERPIELNVIQLKSEIDQLKYDKSTRETQEVIDRVTCRAMRKTSPLTRHDPEPKTWGQAMNSTNAQRWYDAGADEVNGLDDMGTWDVVRPIPGVKPIESKWVFKVKYKPNGEIEKYKGRLVVRGDSQRPGLDYGEVFSPVAHNTICRMLLSMGNTCDFEIDLVDVCQAFLNAPLKEEVYMRPAPGVTQILGIPEDSWLKLKRNLYGLKQAPRNWSLTFIDWMTNSQGFKKASIDDCLFYKEFRHDGKDVFILLLMYVDDHIIISNDRTCLDKFKADMHARFKIVDKGPIRTYLGIEIERDRVNRTLKIHQKGYLHDILSAMNIKPDNPLTYDTPLPAGIILTKNEDEPYELDLYRSAIGSLIYLSQWTRIDIAYAVSALAAYTSNPSRDHHVALRHLLHYLHGTRDRGITYHGNDVHGINQIYGFVDADYAGDRDTRRSRSGFIIMMNSGAISWKTKLQTVIANSTTDAEVYAATTAIKEIAYLRDALRRIGLPQATQSEPHKGTLLYEDNEATTAIARTAAHREATKHMAIARSFLRYHHENGTVAFMDCYTSMQVADFLTKSLGHTTFRKLTDEAMGAEMKTDKSKYARRDWRNQYDEPPLDVTDTISLVQSLSLIDEGQGGMMKSSSAKGVGPNLHTKFVDLIYCNCMQIEAEFESKEYIVLSNAEDFLRFDQHRSNICSQVASEDMKTERKLLGDVIFMNRIHVNTSA